MEQDRDYVYIRGKAIQHMTARTQWVCGTCGSRLTTRCLDGAWMTLCYADSTHSVDGFVTKKTWAYLEAKKMMEVAQAQDVFAHLPLELQESILATAEKGAH